MNTFFIGAKVFFIGGSPYIFCGCTEVGTGEYSIRFSEHHYGAIDVVVSVGETIRLSEGRSPQPSFQPIQGIRFKEIKKDSITVEYVY